MPANSENHNKLNLLYLILRLVTALIGLHALVLGLLNWFFTYYWTTVIQMPIKGGDLFWSKQSGAMHVCLAFAYGLGAIRPHYLNASVRMIIFSKSVAILFLYTTYFIHHAQVLVLFAGVVDSTILILTCAFVWGIYRYKNTQEQMVQV